ncbi:MAG TPA: hypothetical protein VM915_16460, partial [Verrucomicrobiae bacterium]|nr:hypothetical protein [Verrucomicrobiae bacterium]
DSATFRTLIESRRTRRDSWFLEPTGLVMTKLDGTAKGGVLVAVAQRHAIPIHFIGVGEKAEDLQQFDAASFSRALVGLE